MSSALAALYDSETQQKLENVKNVKTAFILWHNCYFNPQQTKTMVAVCDVPEISQYSLVPVSYWEQYSLSSSSP